MPCLLRGGGGVSGFSFDPHLLERPIASGGPCSALGDPWHRGRVSHAVLWVFSSPWLGRGPFCLPAPPPAAGGALVPFRPPLEHHGESHHPGGGWNPMLWGRAAMGLRLVISAPTWSCHELWGRLGSTGAPRELPEPTAVCCLLSVLHADW